MQDYFCHVFSEMTELQHPPVSLFSLGRELRFGKDYYYDNMQRQMTGFLFQYTLNGSGVFYDGEDRRIVRKHQAFFTTIPGDTKYCCNLEEHEAWDFLFILIKGECLREYYERIVEKTGHVMTLPLESPPIQYLTDLANRTRNGHISRFNEASCHAFSFITGLYDYFLENTDHYSKRNRDIIALMETNYQKIGEKEGMAGIAEAFHISPSHMTREFVREVGITPSKYLTNIRIQNAKKLLQNTDLSVAEIARLCGYEQANYFCKIFRRLVGQTPLQYRNCMH